MFDEGVLVFFIGGFHVGGIDDNIAQINICLVQRDIESIYRGVKYIWESSNPAHEERWFVKGTGFIDDLAILHTNHIVHDRRL